MLHFANLLLEDKSYLEVETGKQISPDFTDLIPTPHKCCHKIDYRGTEYSRGMFLPLLENGMYFLYDIVQNVLQEDSVSIVCRKTAIFSFNTHLKSYSLNVECDQQVKIIPLNHFKSVPLYIYTLHDETQYIRPKVFFQEI